MDSVAGDQNIDITVVAKAIAAVIDKVYSMTNKKSILFTHSQGGMPGWETARYTDNIASIIAIEPGMGPTVGSDQYNTLVQKKIPIAFYYGDYIGENYTSVPAAAMWTMMRQTAYTFSENYNEDGVKCTVYDLPNEGIYGNDHMMFQDLNNDVIADHIEKWIEDNVQKIDDDSSDKGNYIKLSLYIFGIIFLIF